MLDHKIKTDLRLQVPIPAMVQDFNQTLISEWWACPSKLPDLGKNFSRSEQQSNEKELDSFLDQLLRQVRSLPAGASERQAFQEQLIEQGFAFAGGPLGMKPNHLDLIRRHGFLDANRQFARMARAFDPAITGDDIYQAGRNVMTMNFMQLLLGLPVEVTPAVFAYSMLYPYTDNYIDDPAISPATKGSFNDRFRQRLEGDSITPLNRHEDAIYRLVGMIEGQFERARWPQVYQSLLAIHSAQARSMLLMKPDASPYEVDVLGLSFEKGGTSVLADGYLVAGTLTHDQARFMYGYGAFTQLMDDLEDVIADRHDGRMSIYSQTAVRWPLDAITNRTFQFGAKLFNSLDMFPGPEAPTLMEIITQNINPVLIDTAACAARLYTPGYLQSLEIYVPFRFAALEKQRRKLEKHKATLSKLVEVLV